MIDNELEQLKKYAKALEVLAKKGISDTFSNRNHKHAAIVLSTILKYSKKSFILFDDDLKGDIVNNDQVLSFCDSLSDFVSRGGKIRIAISDRTKDDDENLRDFLVQMSNLFPSQVQIKLASSEFKLEIKRIFNEKINFAVGDNSMYRLEKFGNGSTLDKTGSAYGSFNDKDICNKLLTSFESKYNTCENY